MQSNLSQSALEDAVVLHEHVLRETGSERDAVAAVAKFFSSNRRGQIERRPSSDITQSVCDVTGVTLADLLGPSRVAKVAEARHAAAYLLVANGESGPGAAEILNRNSHNTIRNSCKVVEQRADLQKLVAAVSKRMLELVGEPSKRIPVIWQAKESVA